MTRENGLKFIYKMVGSDLTITTWDDVEKVEICSLGKMSVTGVGMAWRGVVGIHSSMSIPVLGLGVSNGVSRGSFRQK